MEILKITQADIKDGKYIAGAVDFDGHIEIDADLGRILFTSLKATGNIYAEAGWGIEAGLNISVKLRIFAGLIMWRKPEPKELEITCKKLVSGEVAYGKLIETGE